MRNILVTAMFIIVVVLLFVGTISGPGGIRDQIQNRGTEANTKISSLNFGG